MAERGGSSRLSPPSSGVSHESSAAAVGHLVAGEPARVLELLVRAADLALLPRAVKPSISEPGNGHGWELRYCGRPTRTPTSS